MGRECDNTSGPFNFSAVEVQDASGLWCNSSISAREADWLGANPSFLINFIVVAIG
jgi:hypothetical protein